MKVNLLQRTTVRTVVVKTNLGGERKGKELGAEAEVKREARIALARVEETRTGFALRVRADPTRILAL